MRLSVNWWIEEYSLYRVSFSGDKPFLGLVNALFHICAVSLELRVFVLPNKGLLKFPESLYCLLLLSFSLVPIGKRLSVAIFILVTRFTNALATAYERLWDSNSPPVPRQSASRPSDV